MECYLDNSATTKPCKAAVDAEISALTELYGKDRKSTRLNSSHSH